MPTLTKPISNAKRDAVRHIRYRGLTNDKRVTNYNYEYGFEVLGLQDIVGWYRFSNISTKKWEQKVRDFCKGVK